jgi:universal stress protein E
MRTVRRILVAVKEPSARPLPALAKAAQLARACGAKLELFHAMATPLYMDPNGLADGSLRDVQRNLRASELRRLENMAARLRKDGIRVTTAVEWDFPVYEAIVREARRFRADLIVANCHGGRRIAPWLLRLTDWELLRHSPVAVLLIKNPRRYRHPVLLAAVDPTHAFSKPTKLDDEVLSAASALKQPLRGTLHAVHAYLPLPAEAVSTEVVNPRVLAELEASTAARARAGFERALRKAHLPRSRQHLVGRHPIDAIESVARQIRSAIVVMGAVSRSGLKGVFIGNTAERVLDSLSCDVLVVKPQGLASHVARARRGVRLIAPQLLPPF